MATARAFFELLEQRINLTNLPTGFTETVIAANLGAPSATDVLPDGRVLVNDQAGNVRVIKGGKLLSTPLIHIAVDFDGERGLIGITHDPNFATNHFIYLYHTVAASGSAAAFNEVSRFTVSGDVASPSSEVDILKLNDLSSATNHNGGGLHFGKDGMLYIGVGENAHTPNAQTLSNLLGKVLRIDVSRIVAGDPINDVTKLIPADNPFVNKATGINQAIFALGFRNPYTFAVEPGTGTIFVDDVGESTWEEIDKLVAGGNYGWSKSEGFASKNPPAGLGPGTYQQPLLAYNHDGGPAGGGNAIIGGVFYDPPAGAANAFPSTFDGKYFYADFGHDWIRVFDPAHPGSIKNPDTSSSFATSTGDLVTSMSAAPDGGIFYTDQANGGELREIVPRSKAKPTITHRPANQTAALGASATFVVRTSGPQPIAYRWQRADGDGPFLNIKGATTSHLTVDSVTKADTKARFRVVAINANGRTYSRIATISLA